MKIKYRCAVCVHTALLVQIPGVGRVSVAAREGPQFFLGFLKKVARASNPNPPPPAPLIKEKPQPLGSEASIPTLKLHIPSLNPELDPKNPDAQPKPNPPSSLFWAFSHHHRCATHPCRCRGCGPHRCRSCTPGPCGGRRVVPRGNPG